jgi:RND family efflux transporter MFP subunit
MKRACYNASLKKDENNMKDNIKFILTLLAVCFLSITFIPGCSSDDQEESKSMEQIQKEEGIPVEVEHVTPEYFEKVLAFYGKFKGQRETTIGAMIGGRIEKINFSPGDNVKKDDVIIQFPMDSPGSQIQQAQSTYENSKKTYERMKALYEKGEIAQAQYDGAETRYEVDKRNYETMKDMLRLDAPYDGTITEFMVHEGDNVKAKDPLFTIAKLDTMMIRIWLSDEERMLIKKGMKAIATVNSKSFIGKVSVLSFSVNQMKEAFYADLIFENRKREILAGTTADIRVVLYENKNAIVVPRNLINHEDGKSYVFLAEGGTAKKQYVTIGTDNGVDYEITGGLNINDPLITKGSVRLSDGTKIKVIK